MRLLLVLSYLAVFLAGCQTSPPSAGEPIEPVQDPVQVEKSFVGTYNLTLLGAWHTPAVDGPVAGEAGYYNCVVIGVKRSELQRLNATAIWDNGANVAEERIAVFHRLKSEKEPASEIAYTEGPSPLHHFDDDLANETGLTVGVQLPPSVPAGFGTVDVSLHLEAVYLGEPPRLVGPSTCGEELA